MTAATLRVRGRDRRALMLGAIVLAPALIWALAARPAIAGIRALRQTLATERGLLARELRLVADAPGYPVAARAATRDLEALALRLFAAPSEGAAGAALAGYLRRHAAQSEVRVVEMRSAPVAPVDSVRNVGLQAVAVRLVGESDLEGLATMLESLETGPRLVHVDDLEVQPRDDAEVGDNRAEVLTFQFSVTGFALDTARREPVVRTPAGREQPGRLGGGR